LGKYEADDSEGKKIWELLAGGLIATTTDNQPNPQHPG